MKSKVKIFIAFILNLFFSIFEFIGGILTGSISITSDAIHDFGDATTIGLSFFFEKLSDKKPNNKYTYGYVRYSVLSGLITILILIIGSCLIIYNGILNLITPKQINYNGMIIFAIIGLIINIIATYFTHGGKSINQKAVNLHMFEDVFGWLIVLIGAIIIRLTSFYIIDPILSIILSIIIIITSLSKLKEILDIFLIKTPKNIDIEELKEHIKEIKNVLDVHHFHVWSLDGENNCATLHVVISNNDPTTKIDIKNELLHHGITHVTLETENPTEICNDKFCNIKQTTSHCHHHKH